MSRASSGFSLIELVVVVLIIGIVVMWSIGYFTKAVESSKADGAISMLKTIAKANYAYALNNRNLLTGAYTDSATGNSSFMAGKFGPGGPCPTNCANPTYNQCKLISCGYMSEQDWLNLSYDFYACDPNGGGCGAGAPAFCTAGTPPVACAVRNGSGPYAGAWGYTHDQAGLIMPQGAAPSPPP